MGVCPPPPPVKTKEGGCGAVSPHCIPSCGTHHSQSVCLSMDGGGSRPCAPPPNQPEGTPPPPTGFHLQLPKSLPVTVKGGWGGTPVAGAAPWGSAP